MKKSKYRRKRRIKPGAPPGLTDFPDSPDIKEQVQLIQYNEATATQFEPENLNMLTARHKPGFMHWLIIKEVEQAPFLNTLGSHFNLHPLVLEDILHLNQRPKLNDFDDYLFITLKVPFFHQQTKELSEKQLSFVLGPDYLISFQEDDTDLFAPVIERILKNKGKIRKQKTDYLAYAILDLAVDHFTLLIEELEEQMDSLEDVMSADNSSSVLKDLYQSRQAVITLRKSILPLREIIRSLERRESALIAESTVLYLRDVYEHTVQIIESIETFRELLATTHDIHLSLNSNRMNQVMQMLTIFASIFIPLTFLVGVYGMNFKYMPELDFPWAYPLLLGIMLVVTLLMLRYFRKRGWLRSEKKLQKKE